MSNRLHIGGVMTFVLLGLIFSSGTSWVWAEDPKEGVAGDVQERRVPNMKLAPMTQGLVVQGNQLRAMPGYKLVKGPMNTVSARQSNGALLESATCGCSGGDGSCAITISRSGDVAVCSKDVDNVCSGLCIWVKTSSPDLGSYPGGTMSPGGPQIAPPRPTAPKLPRREVPLSGIELRGVEKESLAEPTPSAPVPTEQPSGTK